MAGILYVHILTLCCILEKLMNLQGRGFLYPRICVARRTGRQESSDVRLTTLRFICSIRLGNIHADYIPRGNI